ncbi:hypothetical protein KBI23_18075 [bacterium]|nr:hypothetical protein [bacterium]MBP9811411.1 hypothetical protein [bacterium]
MNTQTVDLMSLYNDKTNEVVVPKGISASYDSSKGPCVLRGNLENHGTITITGPKKSSQVIIAAEIINDGAFVCQVESLSLCSSVVRNSGDIKAENSLDFKATIGKLSIDGSGSVTASQVITFSGPLGITVKDGSFESSSLRFEAENGTVFVQADKLDGAISVNAKSSRIGTKSAMLKDGKSALLSGTHVYYSTSNLSLGSISHAGDAVVLLAGGEISVGSITAGTLYVGAGVSFTIDGQYPDPTSDSDVDVAWSVSGPGYQPLVVSGAINVSGEATIKAWTVEATDVTVGGNLEVNTLNEYGEITLTGDLDVDGDASLLAYTINFEGEDFNVAGELVMGASASTGLYSYINLAGSLTASDNVSLNCQLTTFLGDDFTMDGTDKVLATSGHLRIEATNFINIKADVTTSEGRNLLFYSDGDVATGSITVDNSEASSAGAVIIKAHRTGGSTEFVIGGTDETNGVNGSITTDTVDGGATEVTSFSHGAVYITNGGDGGITVTSASNISVKGTSSKSGGITLNAEDGTIKLPAGTLSADGTGANPGSFIQLLAETIETVDGTIISASDSGVSDTQKLLQIAANNITLTGTSGLEIKANGGGNSAYPTYLQIFPKGSVSIYDNDYTTSFLYWYNTESISGGGAAPVSFNGAGTARLKISCNGSHARTFISGYPLVFNTGETQIECKGDEDHEIQISRYSATGGDGLQFVGDDVTIDASGLDDGDGGLIAIYMDPVYRSDTGKVVMKADGKDTGDGGHILLQPGTSDLVFGTADEQYSFSSKGGLTSGSGGKIEIQGYSSSIEVIGATDTTTVLDVSVPGTDGHGGEINITAYGAAGLTFDASNPSYLKANGGSASGDGGKIVIVTSNVPMTIGAGNGDVSLSAVAQDGDSAGGTIDLMSWYGITAESINIDVSAHGTGDGGTIKLNAGYSTLTLNGGELNADGGDDGGNGGTLHVEGGQITLPAEENTLLSADGKSGGDGGTVEVVTQWASVDIGSDDNQILVSAKGAESAALRHRTTLVNGSGNGGHVYTWQSKSYTVAAGATLAVTAYDNGKGGKIEINCTESVTVNGEMKADGLGDGDGGLISIEAPELILGTGAKFSAEGGVSIGGKGGKIEIKNSAATAPLDIHLWLTELFLAKGYGSAEGGQVIIDKIAGFDVHSVIKVNGGDDVTVGSKFGSIKLNGVLCQQYKAHAENWPLTYWKNFTPGTPDSTIADFARLIDEGVRARFQAAGSNLYYMDTYSQFDTFFASTSPSNVTGITIRERFVTAVLTTEGSAPITADLQQATTAHELAHQLDYILAASSSPPALPSTNGFAAAKNAEYALNTATHINYSGYSCNDVLGATVCGIYSGTNGAKLDAWVGGDVELFANVFSEVTFPGKSYAQLVTALSFLPDTKTYMTNLIDSL